MIKKILIANRGEIAVRIIKTCQKLNIKTVAIYSDLDINSLYTKLADEVYCLTECNVCNDDNNSLANTYLNIDKIINIAKISGADAIHPGYGFLSENSNFAQKTVENNIIFIGPDYKAIDLMGVKSTAKNIAKQAGMPILESYQLDDNNQIINNDLSNIKYPILIKAAYGGGGKGMRIVNKSEELELAIQAAKREALKSFGNDELIIEQYITNSRHIEVQVLLDKHNNSVYLFERDCSIQRRYQKIIEEAPAVNLPKDVNNKKFRDIIGQKALDVAKAVNYIGVGTVELLFDTDNNNYYFMEMNTRLQVEHPVTEMITGIDLVEQQILVASNHKLQFKQEDLKINGHAIEARIYAEDVLNNFLPAVGKINYLDFNFEDIFDKNYIINNTRQNIRLDTGIEQNNKITINYDPLLAKVTAWGNNRAEAINNLTRALQNSYIIGVKNNIVFLLECLQNNDFINFNITTGFINNNYNKILNNIKADNNSKDYNIALIAAGIFFNNNNNNNKNKLNNINPWDYQDNWRLLSKNQINFNINFIDSNNNYFKNNIFIENIANNNLIILLNNNQLKNFSENYSEYSKDNNLSSSHHEYSEEAREQKYLVENIFYNNIINHNKNITCDISFIINNKFYSIKAVYINNNKLFLYINNLEFVFTNHVSDSFSESKAKENSLIAPMPGRVVSINVKNGSKVSTGDVLLILEAMKMEHTVLAPKDGTVKDIYYQQGQQVELGAELLVVE